MWLSWVLSGEYHEVEIVLPPVVWIGIHNASSLADGLFGQRFQLCVTRFQARLREMPSRASLAIREIDRDFVNVKYCAWEAQHVPTARTLHWVFPCQKHGNNHNVNSISDTVDDFCDEMHGTGSQIGAVRCFSRWGCMGNNYMRFMGALEEVFEDMWRYAPDTKPSRGFNLLFEHEFLVFRAVCRFEHEFIVFRGRLQGHSCRTLWDSSGIDSCEIC